MIKNINLALYIRRKVYYLKIEVVFGIERINIYNRKFNLSLKVYVDVLKVICFFFGLFFPLIIKKCYGA